MLRPKRPRRIMSKPIVSEFRPRGIQTDSLTIVTLEQFEALRLIDYEGMDQSQVAEVMNVSHHTVGRVLKSAKGKVAGGSYKFHSSHDDKPHKRMQGKG